MPAQYIVQQYTDLCVMGAWHIFGSYSGSHSRQRYTCLPSRWSSRPHPLKQVAWFVWTGGGAGRGALPISAVMPTTLKSALVKVTHSHWQITHLKVWLNNSPLWTRWNSLVLFFNIFFIIVVWSYIKRDLFFLLRSYKQ